MDAGAPIGPPAADLQQQYRDLTRVLLVLGEMRAHDELFAAELLRPVALLARFPRGTKVLDGRWDRPGISLERHREDLPHSRYLCPHEPGSARPDVAVDAGPPGVRRGLVGPEFRLHDGVARLAAELRGVHVFDAAVGRRAEEQGVDAAQDDDENESASQHRLAQVDLRVDVR